VHLLLVACFVIAATTSPGTRGFDEFDSSSHSTGETQIVAPTVHGGSIAATDRRSNAPHSSNCPVFATTLSSPTLVSEAHRASTVGDEPDAVTRWIRGHATTSAIP
jgi:hypothetical protein